MRQVTASSLDRRVLWDCASQSPIVRKSSINASQFGGGDKCPVCEKTVYISERLELGDKAIHKTCLKCVACSMRLTVENYHTHADQFYCRQHYNEVHFGPSVPNPEVRFARPGRRCAFWIGERWLRACRRWCRMMREWRRI